MFVDFQVRIPKFKLEKDVNLVNALRHMGMESSFCPSANFTGITSHRPLFIGDIKQRAVIEVTNFCKYVVLILTEDATYCMALGFNQHGFGF